MVNFIKFDEDHKVGLLGLICECPPFRESTTKVDMVDDVQVVINATDGHDPKGGPVPVFVHLDHN